MPSAQWPLYNDRPVIELVLSLPGALDKVCRLIADTGAGSRHSIFQLILAENLCLQFGGALMSTIPLGGAYSGYFPLYMVNVRLPQLNFNEPVPVVGVTQQVTGFDGIAGFKFLTRFHYGNFGNADAFGLDTLASP